MCRVLPGIITRVANDLLVNLHWKELIICFSFKYVLVGVKGHNSSGSPCLVAVKVDIFLEGVMRPTCTLVFPVIGEFFHSLGDIRCVKLHLSSGISADSICSFCTKSLTVRYFPRGPA